MKKALLLALAGGLMMATSAVSSSAEAGYGHKRVYHSYSYHKVYKPVHYVYRYNYVPVYYKPACKWVYEYGHAVKKCW